MATESVSDGVPEEVQDDLVPCIVCRVPTRHRTGWSGAGALRPLCPPCAKGHGAFAALISRRQEWVDELIALYPSAGLLRERYEAQIAGASLGQIVHGFKTSTGTVYVPGDFVLVFPCEEEGRTPIWGLGTHVDFESTWVPEGSVKILRSR